MHGVLRGMRTGFRVAHTSHINATAPGEPLPFFHSFRASCCPDHVVIFPTSEGAVGGRGSQACVAYRCVHFFSRADLMTLSGAESRSNLTEDDPDLDKTRNGAGVHGLF